MTFQLSVPCYKPQPPGGKLEVFAPPFTIENLPGLRILMSKPCHFPCTERILEKQLPCYLTRISPTLPRVGGVAMITNGWCIMICNQQNATNKQSHPSYSLFLVLKINTYELRIGAMLHELKLLIDPKLPLSSRTLLVKMELIFCCIKQF